MYNVVITKVQFGLYDSVHVLDVDLRRLVQYYLYSRNE